MGTRLLLFFLMMLPTAPQAAGTPHVVVTLKPIHSLVAGVMQGVATPWLLLEGGQSPHRYNLKPSDARALHHADFIVWVGPEMEGFLIRPLGGIKTRRLTLLDVPGMHVLPARRLSHLHTHPAEAHAPVGRRDGHIWLDPRNAAVIVDAVATQLARMDPTHATRYRTNAARLASRIEALDHDIEIRTTPLRGRPFVIFHDAFHYFENRYGLHPTAILTIAPDRRPGARRVREIRRLIHRRKVRCVFAEPQFRSHIVDILAEGSAARIGVLDPLGADLRTGPEAWFKLLDNITTQMEKCLGDP